VLGAPLVPGGRQTETCVTASDATVLNIAATVQRHAELTPDRPAIVSGGERLTYRDLDVLSGRVARALEHLGIRRGDHVALSCPNLPAFPIVYFGILKLGAVVVPINVLCKTREIAYHLRDSDARAYFCFEGTPELPMGAMGKAAFDEIDGCQQFILLPRRPGSPAADDVKTLETLLAGAREPLRAAPTRPDDTAVMLYTSGTTGQAKGAELTHFNIFLNAVAARDLGWPLRTPGAQEVALITLPLFHSFGQVAQLVTHVLAGDVIVLMPRFEPGGALDHMARHRVTFWAGVPTMYWALLHHVETAAADPGGAAAHLKFCISGGAPMPVKVMTAFERTFGVRILEGYGLSETSPVATFNHLERPSRPGTVGHALLGVEVACVDDEDRPVGPGQIGEVVIRGHNIMKGYYKRPEATAAVMRHGWFHTGDMGMIDEDGYLAIVDRKKDMIIRGGCNVYPREVEELLLGHSCVELCAVIGIPDERLGEDVKAIVVRKPGASVTEQELIDWCDERMASFKRPRSVAFVEHLPMTATGKVLKRELRDQIVR
jgi:long-chain acyl-CoA synthetase